VTFFGRGAERVLTAPRRIQGGRNVMLGISNSWGFVNEVTNLGLYTQADNVARGHPVVFEVQW